MNVWDRVFWILFVFLEVAIISVSAIMFNPLGILLGFTLIGAGVAMVGDHSRHKSLASEVEQNRETMRRITNWLNRQYELTHGIKDIHDHRFHTIDKKRTELEEAVERGYRELAGKIIDLENKINIASKVRLSDARQPTLKESAEHVFDIVWRDIRNLANSKKSVSTLSRGVKNRVLRVSDDGILLRSELTKKEREVMKHEFRHFWDILKDKGKLDFLRDIEDPKLVRIGSIIISFLALLPYIEYGVKPRVLYLMRGKTHEPGTLKQRALTI